MRRIMIRVEDIEEGRATFYSEAQLSFIETEEIMAGMHLGMSSLTYHLKCINRKIDQHVEQLKKPVNLP